MMRLTDVVKNLLILNVVVYLVAMLVIGIPNYKMLGFYYPDGSGNFQPFQIISHMFMHSPNHGGTLLSFHLLFNMIGLYFFGPPLEALWGPKRFLLYYLFAGFGALIIHVLMIVFKVIDPVGVVGASGAVFGLLAGFGYHYPNQKVMLLFPPIPMKAKYFVVVFGIIELSLGFSGANTGIAHFAHVGGAIFGFLLILYWRKFGSQL